MHKCPACGADCDCESAEELLKRNPDLTSKDLEVYDCDHDCEEDEE